MVAGARYVDWPCGKCGKAVKIDLSQVEVGQTLTVLCTGCVSSAGQQWPDLPSVRERLRRSAGADAGAMEARGQLLRQDLPWLCAELERAQRERDEYRRTLEEISLEGTHEDRCMRWREGVDYCTCFLRKVREALSHFPGVALSADAASGLEQ